MTFVILRMFHQTNIYPKLVYMNLDCPIQNWIKFPWKVKKMMFKCGLMTLLHLLVIKIQIRIAFL